ncbi:MAG: FdtA/QdtA family cupin domain-containing protein [Verrucomicrobiota bacterium]
MSTQHCRLIELEKIADPAGNLTAIESNRQIPFAIQRMFYLYDVPGGEQRAGHALKSCHQFLIAMSGSFDVLVDNGIKSERYQLNRPYRGLYIPPLVWREIDNFSSGSVCAVLASEPYDEDGYYRSHESFAAAVKEARRTSR